MTEYVCVSIIKICFLMKASKLDIEAYKTKKNAYKIHCQGDTPLFIDENQAKATYLALNRDYNCRKIK